MNTPSPASAELFVAHVEKRRRRIVAAGSRDPADGDRPPSIAASMFVSEFLDRFCELVLSGDGCALDAWLDDVRGRRRSPDDGSSIILTCSAAAASFVAERGPCDEIVHFTAIVGKQLAARVDRLRVAGGASVELEKALPSPRDEAVRALLSAMQAHDPVLGEHSRAVGALCGRLAKALRMTPQAQAFATMCGLLHDIGMIAMPADVLQKRSPLDESDWVLMRAHSRTGARILESVASLRDAAPIVRAHHERPDGEGYPDRLSGSAVPAVARIVAVADGSHAMVSKRPYREAVPPSRALKILAAGRGRQWDAHAVDAMLSIVRPSHVRTLTIRANACSA